MHAIGGGGLGVLVLLQRWAQEHAIRLKLFNPSELVREKLKHVNFEIADDALHGRWHRRNDLDDAEFIDCLELRSARTASDLTPPLPLRCAICGKPILPKDFNVTEDAKPVHGEC